MTFNFVGLHGFTHVAGTWTNVKRWIKYFERSIQIIYFYVWLIKGSNRLKEYWPPNQSKKVVKQFNLYLSFHDRKNKHFNKRYHSWELFWQLFNTLKFAASRIWSRIWGLSLLVRTSRVQGLSCNLLWFWPCDKQWCPLPVSNRECQ